MELFSRISSRTLFGFGFLLSFFALIISVLIYNNLPPCPLCELQQMVAIILAILLLLAFIHNSHGMGNRIYGLILFLVACLGLVLAIHQFDLQRLPIANAQACSLGFMYLIQALPLKQAVVAILQGAGECGGAQWHFLRLSLVEWSIIYFTIIALLGFWQTIRPHRIK